MVQQKTRCISRPFLTSFRFPIITSWKGDPTATATGRRKGITSTSSRIRSRRNARSEISWVFTNRFIRDERSRKSMIELGCTEEVCREMDKLANEDHTHHATAEEISVYRNNWWIRSNFVGSDTMPNEASGWFQTSIVYFATPRETRGSGLLPKLVAKLFLILVELARFLVAFFIRVSPRRWTQHWSIGKTLLNGDWANYSWNDSQN